MKYIIELRLADGKWDRSWSFADVYTMDEAQGLLDTPAGYPLDYRITPFHKRYCRHAAASHLELRGAIAMLKSARAHVVIEARRSQCGPCDANYFAPFTILTNARLEVTRQMETL
jgi:hypothetical protein